MTSQGYEALFSDETPFFRAKIDNEHYQIRFRVKKGEAISIYLLCGRTEIKMNKEDCEDELFDYYITQLVVREKISYQFLIIKKDIQRYYHKLGVSEVPSCEYAFHIVPDFEVPKWAQSGVAYQIFVDRFYNGEEKNDVLTNEYAYIGHPVVRANHWEEQVKELDVHRFYGGDLQGVEQKLKYIQSLGVEIIYLNPIFLSPSNHKYDVQDYDYIDPHFAVIEEEDGVLLEDGELDNTKATKYIQRVTSKKNLEASNQYFCTLVQKIHERGMKVILDGVFNHCGSSNKWMDREGIYAKSKEIGAFRDKKSPYVEYFHFKEDKWPNNTSYDGWWGMNTLPKLNHGHSKELYQDILRIAKKWVAPPYNVDGWRLDVAADLGENEAFNHQFWTDFREAVKTANPDALILAEHYGDPREWIKDGDQWDSVMNYDAFMEPISWFLTGLDKHSDAFDFNKYGNAGLFVQVMKEKMSRFHYESLSCAMNEISNHDHSRFLTRTNSTVGRLSTRGADAAARNTKKAVMKEAVVMMMTLPGMPTIYYGDEAGLAGWTDPDNRRTYPWGREDLELIEFHRYAIRLHQVADCLQRGSLKFLLTEQHILAYGRFTQEDQVVVVINNSDVEKTLFIPVWQIGVKDGAEALTRTILTWDQGINVGKVKTKVDSGYLAVSIGAKNSIVYYAAREGSIKRLY